MTGLFLSIALGRPACDVPLKPSSRAFAAQGAHIAVLTIEPASPRESKNAEAVGEVFAYTPSRETNGCGKPATVEPPVITSKPWADSAPTPNNLKI